MKKFNRHLVAAGAALLIAIQNLPAQDQPASQNQPTPQTQPPPQNQPPAQTQPPPGQYALSPQNLYLSGGIGPAFVEDITINSAGGAKQSVDVGYRFSAAFGTKITENISAGFETGTIGNWFSGDFGQPLAGFSDAYMYQVPLLVTGTFNFPLQRGITPYAGAGIGGVISTLYLRHPFFGSDWDSDIQFAFQLEGGVRFTVAPNMEVGFAYKFLGAMGPSFFGDSPVFLTRMGDVYTHSLMATFTWNF